MHSKFTLLFIFSILVSSSLFAQHKYEIGIEGGLTFIKYKIKDAGGNMRTGPCVSALPGINVRMNTKNKFFGEVAVAMMEYTDGMKLKQQEVWGVSNSDEILMVPFRFGYSLKLFDKLSLAPVIGISGAIKTTNYDGTSATYEPWYRNPPTYWIYHRRDLQKNIFFLAQGGLALEYQLLKHWKTTLGFNYYQGLTDHAIYDIEYAIKSGPKQYATMYGKGSFTNLQLGIKYLFGKKPKAS
jgi:hypothetical protein